MGKGARNRRRREQARPPAAAAGPTAPDWDQPGDGITGPVPGGSPQAREMVEQLLQDTQMPGQAVYLDDPIFGGKMAPVTNVTPDGSLVTDPGAPAEQIPVLLFEPTRMMAVRDGATGQVRELRTEAMVSMGFHRVPTRFLMVTLPADGWGVYRVPGGVVLRDGDGAIRAESTLDLDPQWVSAAASQRSVIVLFGPKLGIRVEPGQPPYTDQTRAAEFRRGRREGSLLVASVAWCGDLDEAVNWVLFGSGSFGLPGPVAYVPSWHFRPFGGPAAFGFGSLAGYDAGPVEIPEARGLAAELTPTDMDLIRPGAEADLSLITGYHAPPGEPEFAAWRTQALHGGQVFVVTGPRPMPWGPGASPELALEALCQSEVASIPLTAGSLRAAGRPGRPEPARPATGPDGADQEEYAQLLTEKLRTQGSYNVYFAPAVADLIGAASLQALPASLWPVTCQSCGEPLGTKADASADQPDGGDRITVSLHHSACRPSGSPPRPGTALPPPTTSYVIGSAGRPSRPGRGDVPVMIINPSCEQAQLARAADGTWRGATLDWFAGAGFTTARRLRIPPRIPAARAELDGPLLTVRIGDEPGGRHRWTVEPPDHAREQVIRYGSVILVVTTRVLPVLVTPEDFPAAIATPDALLGRADLSWADEAVSGLGLRFPLVGRGGRTR